MQILIDFKATVYEDKRGLSPLHHASLQGKSTTLKHLKIRLGHSHALEILLRYSDGLAHIDSPDHKGNKVTNFQHHFPKFRSPKLDRFYKQISNLQKKKNSTEGNTPLHMACYMGSVSCASVLLRVRKKKKFTEKKFFICSMEQIFFLWTMKKILLCIKLHFVLGLTVVKKKKKKIVKKKKKKFSSLFSGIFPRISKLYE